MKNNSSRDYIALTLVFVAFIATVFIGAILVLSGCTPAKPAKTEKQIFEEKFIVLNEYRAKYGEDFTTWTPEQQETLVAAYKKIEQTK